MDWLKLHPEDLVERAEPGDLLPQIRSMRSLSAEAQQTLNYAFCQWTLYALSRPADIEGVLELDDLFAVALRLLQEGGDTATLRIRWQAFRDLVDAKRLVIGSAESGRARNLLHAGPILKRLESGPVSQTALRDELKLSAPRLSQVLGVMEDGGLIQRNKRGKENFVSLPLHSEREPGAPGDHGPANSTGKVVWGAWRKAA